jgi:hypothetical protein
MKKASISLILLVSSVCVAQTDNTFYARQFAGTDVGAKVANAQKSCLPATFVPCIIIIDPSLAAWPTGAMPTKCAQCNWMDYRSGTLSTAGPGVFNTSISNCQNASYINGADLTMFAGSTPGIQGGVCGAVIVPSNATTGFSAAAIIGLASTNGNTTYGTAVGAYLQGRALTPNSIAEGANIVAISDPTAPNAVLQGIEVDVDAQGANTQVLGVSVNGFNWTSQPNWASAYIVAAPTLLVGGFWNYAFYSYDGVGPTFAYIGTKTMANGIGSQVLQFQNRTSGGAEQTSTINTDLNGQFNFTPIGAVSLFQGTVWSNGGFNTSNGAVIPNTATGYSTVNSGTKVVIAPTIPGSGATLMTGPTTSTSGDLIKFSDAVGTLADAGLSATKMLANCGTMTTTAAASNTLACTWVTTSSTCAVTPSNATAVAWTYYTPTANTVTVYHAAIAGATYAIACSAN